MYSQQYKWERGSPMFPNINCESFTKQDPDSRVEDPLRIPQQIMVKSHPNNGLFVVFAPVSMGLAAAASEGGHSEDWWPWASQHCFHIVRTLKPRSP